MVGITLKNVTKRFGRVTAVDDVSLEVRRGELYFLLGPSGCGKTTILRLIAGFGLPDAGEIYFDDRPMSAVPPHRRNTALVFQNYALWPHKSVAENVAYGLEERRMPKAQRAERVRAALRTVHMEEYADRMPNELSGGQQQRVALARALVVEPDAVLLDEPLSNLDARLRLEMRSEIRRIHDETGITMLYVTHDQKEALSMADRIAVMSMGRVEQVGDPRTLYRRPTNRFVADFLGEANFIPGRVVERDDDTCLVRTRLGDLRARCAAPSAPDSPVELMVRPECLRFGESGTNSFHARVVRNVYLGEIEQFVLEASGLTLVLAVANPREGTPRSGEAVAASFLPDDAVALPTTEARRS